MSLPFFVVLLFLGSLFDVSGANFCFWVSVLVLRFFDGFLPMFLLYFCGSLPKVFGKILLMSGLLFFGFVLSSLVFFFSSSSFFSCQETKIR